MKTKMQLVDNKDITLILPTLDEEKNIKDALDIVNNLYPGISVIVADDGSADKTQDLVMDYKQGNVTLLDRSAEKENGLTGSILDAVRLVNTEHIIVMDADLQHPPEKIANIAETLRYNDIVIGMREKVEGDWPFHRKMMSINPEKPLRISKKWMLISANYLAVLTDMLYCLALAKVV